MTRGGPCPPGGMGDAVNAQSYYVGATVDDFLVVDDLFRRDQGHGSSRGQIYIGKGGFLRGKWGNTIHIGLGGFLENHGGVINVGGDNSIKEEGRTWISWGATFDVEGFVALGDDRYVSDRQVQRTAALLLGYQAGDRAVDLGCQKTFRCSNVFFYNTYAAIPYFRPVLWKAV